jgi:hypothetical protein
VRPVFGSRDPTNYKLDGYDRNFLALDVRFGLLVVEIDRLDLPA